MSSRLPALVQGASSSPEASEWHITVMKALGPDLGNKVSRMMLNNGRITVTAASSAWAARIRFHLAEIESALREKDPSIEEIVVRVRPASAARKG